MCQRITKGLALLLVAVLIHGCTTTRPVPLSQEGIETLRPGQEVRVVTRNDQVHQFKVSEITDQDLAGEDERIPFEDMTHLDRREFSGGRTTVLLVSLAAGVAVLVVIIVSTFSLGPLHSRNAGSTTNQGI